MTRSRARSGEASPCPLAHVPDVHSPRPHRLVNRDGTCYSSDICTDSQHYSSPCTSGCGAHALTLSKSMTGELVVRMHAQAVRTWYLTACVTSRCTVM
jgi:hypothetical protein